MASNADLIRKHVHSLERRVKYLEVLYGFTTKTRNRHKHAEAIIAWANGAVIEKLEPEPNGWQIDPHPKWYPDNQYRIAPHEL